MEIVSERSLGRDRGEKSEEYEAAGIAECWLLDPQREWAEFYRLDEAGRNRVISSGAKGIYHSEAVSGFWLKVEWLWQEPLSDMDIVS